MNDIITATNESMPTKRAEAEYLHYEILRNGNDAAEAMCNLAMNLKRMRDERLYTELGYNTFEDYTENAVGLKKSQAYDYIKALENLGEDVFRSSGRFGISKVKVLTAFTPAEAAAFIDENDIDGMTVKELKSKVEELTSHGEQLSMEMAQSKSTSESEIKKLQDDIRKLKAQNAQLETENDELQHRPIEVAVREPSQAEIAEYSKTAVEQAIAEREKKHAEEIKKIKVAARKEAEERVKSVNSQLAEEISKIRQHSAELEKQLKLSASPEITRFSFYFDALQSNVKNLADTLSKINDVETAAKLKANMCKFADMLKGMFM